VVKGEKTFFNYWRDSVFLRRRHQIIAAVYWLYKKLPIAGKTKSNVKNYILKRFPSVTKNVVMGQKSNLIWENIKNFENTLLLPPPVDEKWVLVISPSLSIGKKKLHSDCLAAFSLHLKKLGFKVTFVSASLKKQYEEDLTSHDITVFYGLDDAQEHLIEEGYKYQFALITNSQVAFDFNPVVRAYAINAEVIYYIEGLQLENVGFDNTIEKISNIDRVNVDCADRIITSSESERTKLLKFNPEKLIDILPFSPTNTSRDESYILNIFSSTGKVEN
jgi:hypothetical protein